MFMLQQCLAVSEKVDIFKFCQIKKKNSSNQVVLMNVGIMLQLRFIVKATFLK